MNHIEAMKQALEALEPQQEHHRTFKLEVAHTLRQAIAEAEKQEREWVGLTDELEALFTNIDHAISSGAWNVQKGSQTWEIIEHAKAAHGIKEKNT